MSLKSMKFLMLTKTKDTVKNEANVVKFVLK